MKKYFILIAAAGFAASCGDGNTSGYKITGELPYAEDSTKVFMVYQTGEETVRDSAYVKNGKFEFKGDIADPVGGFIMADFEGRNPAMPGFYYPDNFYFYFENGNIKLTTTDSLKNSKVTGSKINADKAAYDEYMKEVTDQWAKLNEDYYAAMQSQDQDAMNSIRAQADVLNETQSTRQRDFIKANPDSYFAFLEIYPQVIGSDPDIADAEETFGLFSERLRNTNKAKEYTDRFDQIRATSVGAMAPDFSQNDPDGNPIKLSDFRGQFVLLDFWASWCGPCRAENPHVVAAYNEYKDKGFTVFGVSLDDNRENWLKAIEDDNLTWKQVSDLKGWANEASSLYGVRGIPANYLIDPDGRIVAKNLRGSKLTEALQKNIP